MGWSAARWLVSAAVLVGVTAAVMARHATLSECETPGRPSILAIWVAVSTARVAVSAALRGALWLGWDAALPPEAQPSLLFALVRCEFTLSLLSFMWTTIGLLVAFGSANSTWCDPGLPIYAQALVVLLYLHFAAPMLLDVLFRCTVESGRCSPLLALLQRLAAAGLFQASRLPATDAQLRKLPQERYRPGRCVRWGGRRTSAMACEEGCHCVCLCVCVCVCVWWGALHACCPHARAAPLALPPLQL